MWIKCTAWFLIKCSTNYAERKVSALNVRSIDSYFRGGIYTAHMEKLFKLSNGYFLIYYHRQQVSHLLFLSDKTLLVVVYNRKLV